MMPRAPPEAAPIAAPLPALPAAAPIPAPSPAPSAVLSNAPPTAWLLAAAAAGAICAAAYCWQAACSALNASSVFFGPRPTGIVGAVGGATHAAKDIVAAKVATI